MGLKIETWSIAYRKKRPGLLLNDTSGFKMIKNGHKGWYADPFLFEFNGEIYLFAEYYSYSLRRGVLVYAIYNKCSDKFSNFREIIREEYHLSYPCVFKGLDGNIYMIPESNEKKQLYVYIAISFPEHWEKYKIIKNDIQLVDTTPFYYQDELYALSLEITDNLENNEKFVLFEMTPDNYEIKTEWKKMADMSLDRPGGHLFEFQDKHIFVSQDCVGSYGRALNFSEVIIKRNGVIDRRLFRKIFPEEITGSIIQNASGIHTYNFCNDLEVIDLKYYRNSYYRVLKKAFSR